MPKATLLERIEPERDCPILAGTAKTQYTEAYRAANAFSVSVMEFLGDREPKQKVAWLKTAVGTSREVFQPWNLEIAYVLVFLGRARFTQMHNLLGLSTRTLADKLKRLREAGFIDREIFDEQPVRMEYYLTKHGLRTAALASPLFAYLNHEALRAAGRL